KVQWVPTPPVSWLSELLIGKKIISAFFKSSLTSPPAWITRTTLGLTNLMWGELPTSFSIS
ncbi:1664_t:CDS:1, partial [Ambispora gerdemannii]